MADFVQYYEDTADRWSHALEKLWEIMPVLLKYGTDKTKNPLKFSKQFDGKYSTF